MWFKYRTWITNTVTNVINVPKAYTSHTFTCNIWYCGHDKCKNVCLHKSNVYLIIQFKYKHVRMLIILYPIFAATKSQINLFPFTIIVNEIIDTLNRCTCNGFAKLAKLDSNSKTFIFSQTFTSRRKCHFSPRLIRRNILCSQIYLF